MNQDQLLQAFGAWAQAKHIPVPKTAAGKKVLLARFMHELQSRADQMIGGQGEDQSIEGGDPNLHLAVDGATVQIEDPIHSHYSDFDQLVHERSEAMRQAGGDDLAMNVIHRDKIRNELRQESPFVRTMPPSASDAILGGQATPDSTKPVIEVIRWTGENIEATNVSIATGPVKAPPAFANSATTQRSFLSIIFGSYGYSYNAEIDIGPGQQFTVPCSFMSASIGVDKDGENGLTAGPLLSATLGFRDIMRTAPLTRTKYADLIPSGQVTTFVIPLFAKRFYVILTNTTATATCDLVSTTGGLVQRIPIAAATVQTVPFMLTPDTATLSITPGVATTTIRVIFELEL